MISRYAPRSVLFKIAFVFTYHSNASDTVATIGNRLRIFDCTFGFFQLQSQIFHQIQIVLHVRFLYLCIIFLIFCFCRHTL